MFTILFWKEAWTWFKHHWYWPVIITLLVFTIFTGSDLQEKLFEILQKQRKGYEKEIKILKRADKEKSEGTAAAVESFKEKMKEIEEEHDIKIEELKEEKREELEVIVKKYEDRPEKLAKKIAKILSAEYHRKNK